MNDFTKEELQYISDCVDFGLMDKARNDKFIDLDEKIQSMIDNYCEHEWESGCSSHDCHAECVWCPKCKKDLINE